MNFYSKKVKVSRFSSNPHIKSPEEFIEDLLERINIAYKTMIEEEDKMAQVAFITSILIAFKGRLNRACENL